MFVCLRAAFYTIHSRTINYGVLYVQNLRLYDVDRSRSIFEASGEAALLDCCFQGESAAFSAASDCSITRSVLRFMINYSEVEKTTLDMCI